MKVLEVCGIKKKIGKKEIIKGIDFDIKEGEIFGFLGPNGAGKTTTIRMLVGMIYPDKGTITICNNNLINDKEKALKEVGAVVENPELYTYLSGIENLRQIARIRKVPMSEINKIVELVGLKDRINDKVKNYSLGMKQRVGLAAALIGNPKLLILDEPTNGLDPSGIIDFRKIIKVAAKERGMAVFISSHILSEIQELCDKVAFIENGVIKSIENNNNLATEFESLTVVCNNTDLSVNVIKKIEYINLISVIDNKINITIKSGQTSTMLKDLLANEVSIEEVYKNRKELEERYMELIEGGIR